MKDEKSLSLRQELEGVAKWCCEKYRVFNMRYELKRRYFDIRSNPNSKKQNASYILELYFDVNGKTMCLAHLEDKYMYKVNKSRSYLSTAERLENLSNKIEKSIDKALMDTFNLKVF